MVKDTVKQHLYMSFSTLLTSMSPDYLQQIPNPPTNNFYQLIIPEHGITKNVFKFVGAIFLLLKSNLKTVKKVKQKKNFSAFLS